MPYPGRFVYGWRSHQDNRTSIYLLEMCCHFQKILSVLFQGYMLSCTAPKDQLHTPFRPLAQCHPVEIILPRSTASSPEKPRFGGIIRPKENCNKFRRWGVGRENGWQKELRPSSGVTAIPSQNNVCLSKRIKSVRSRALEGSDGSEEHVRAHLSRVCIRKSSSPATGAKALLGQAITENDKSRAQHGQG